MSQVPSFGAQARASSLPFASVKRRQRKPFGQPASGHGGLQRPFTQIPPSPQSASSPEPAQAMQYGAPAGTQRKLVQTWHSEQTSLIWQMPAPPWHVRVPWSQRSFGAQSWFEAQPERQVSRPSSSRAQIWFSGQSEERAQVETHSPSSAPGSIRQTLFWAQSALRVHAAIAWQSELMQRSPTWQSPSPVQTGSQELVCALQTWPKLQPEIRATHCPIDGSQIWSAPAVQSSPESQVWKVSGLQGVMSSQVVFGTHCPSSQCVFGLAHPPLASQGVPQKPTGTPSPRPRQRASPPHSSSTSHGSQKARSARQTRLASSHQEPSPQSASALHPGTSSTQRPVIGWHLSSPSQASSLVQMQVCRVGWQSSPSRHSASTEQGSPGESRPVFEPPPSGGGALSSEHETVTASAATIAAPKTRPPAFVVAMCPPTPGPRRASRRAVDRLAKRSGSGRRYHRPLRTVKHVDFLGFVPYVAVVPTPPDVPLLPSRVKHAAILLALWGTILAILVGFSEILRPFLAAILIAYLIAPLVDRLARVRLGRFAVPRWLAIIALYVAFFAGVYLFLLGAVPRLYREVARMTVEARDFVNALSPTQVDVYAVRAEAWLEDHGIPIDLGAGEEPRRARPLGPGAPPVDIEPTQQGPRFRFDLHEALEDARGGVETWAREHLPEVVRYSQRLVAGALDGLFVFFFMLMVSAFVLVDVRRIQLFVRSLVPLGMQDDFTVLLGRIDERLSGVVRGQIVICLVNGVLTLVGLSQSWQTGLAALAWIAGIHALEAYFLNPKIMGTAAKIHPAVIAFALLAGERTFGFIGALFAVPTASVLIAVFEHLKEKAHRLDPDAPPPAEPSPPA